MHFHFYVTVQFRRGRRNEQPEDEPNSLVFIFHFHVTVQFRSPVMRDKKKGSAPRHIPQTAARAAWRAAEERA
jgi:hypothetical protein